MSRINTNITSIMAQRMLNLQRDQLNTTLQRLSTGLRINSGKDDPAGLIASEGMKAETAGIQAAQKNIARATNVVSVAESGLVEVGQLLNNLQDLVDRTANTTGISTDERNSNQLEIDTILNSINRIANSTELQGRKLLSGDLQYTTSGVTTSQIGYLQLNSVRVPENSSRTVAINVTTSAQTGVLTYTGGAIVGAPSIEVTGNLGTERLTFASGTALSGIIAAVNASKSTTGVSATVVSTAVKFNTAEYGSSQFVKVKTLSGTFTMSGTEDYGQDVKATVNGASITGDGLKLSVRTTTLDADITLTAGMATQLATAATFDVTGGGAQFAISPKLDVNSVATMGVNAVTTTALGDSTVGYLYTMATGEANAMSTGNFYAAQRIIGQALAQVSSLRGRLGSFQKNTLDTTASALQVQYENVAAAGSTIRDADFAEETANLTREQILVQSATNVLKMANMAPQQILALLQ